VAGPAKSDKLPLKNNGLPADELDFCNRRQHVFVGIVHAPPQRFELRLAEGSALQDAGHDTVKDRPLISLPAS